MWQSAAKIAHHVEKYDNNKVHRLSHNGSTSFNKMEAEENLSYICHFEN